MNKHAKDIVNKIRITTSDILCLTETQIKEGTLNSIILNTLQQFPLHFNSSHDKYQNIA